MQISQLQIFMLMQNQVLVINTGMETTRMAKPFRNQFKQAVGLPSRASHLDVLMAIGEVYNQFGLISKFWEYINKPSSLSRPQGQPLVTPEMMRTRYGI